MLLSNGEIGSNDPKYLTPVLTSLLGEFWSMWRGNQRRLLKAINESLTDRATSRSYWVDSKTAVTFQKRNSA